MVGGGIEFNDRGEHELKGVPGNWRLLSVEADTQVGYAGPSELRLTAKLAILNPTSDSYRHIVEVSGDTPPRSLLDGGCDLHRMRCEVVEKRTNPADPVLEGVRASPLLDLFQRLPRAEANKRSRFIHVLQQCRD